MGIPISACAPTVTEVKVPVSVACLSRADMPAKPAALGDTAMPADVRDREPLLLSKIIEWRRYGERTDAAVAGCP